MEFNEKIKYYFGDLKGRKWTEDDIELKNNCKLIVLTNKGYFIIDSEMVNVSNYIHNLDPEWRKSSILNTKKKSNNNMKI